MYRIVIVGGSQAGVNAVEALRARGHDGEIVLVSAEPELPYDRPPLSKEALRDGPVADRLLLKEQAWYDERNVQLRLGTRAVGLNTATGEVMIEGGASLVYDGLVVATGSTTRGLPMLEGAGVLELRTLRDAATLHERLVAGGHLVVIGAGFIGLEVAAMAVQLGMDVSVIEIATNPLTRVLGEETGVWFRDYHADRGVNFFCARSIVEMDPQKTGTRLVLNDGTRLAADVVVAGVGVTPAVNWLAGSGVDVADGVLCDSALKTSVPNVVAAGDVVRWPHELFGETMRLEQWLNAVEQGAHAAATLLGEPESFAAVPYFWSDQFDARVRFVGRANGATAVHVQRADERSMVTLFARDGMLRGALCINAPRDLARGRAAITERCAWSDALAS